MTKHQVHILLTIFQAISIVYWLMMEKTITGGKGWYFFYGFVTYNCIVNIWRCIFPPDEK